MKQHSFTDFVYEVIGELRQENRFATAYIYHYALQAFTASVGGGKIFWGGLNRRSLCKFQYYLEKEQKSYNTTSTYIRALRAIYNRAVDRGVVAGECRLFVNLKTGVSSEHKLALTAGQTSRLLGDVVDGSLGDPVADAGDIRNRPADGGDIDYAASALTDHMGNGQLADPVNAPQIHL